MRSTAILPVSASVAAAAVQILGYDKTDMPRPGFDPSESVVRYIEKAAKDGAQLVVFPEYLLGQIRQARKNSRNLQQRRPEVYGEIVKPLNTAH